MSQDNKNQTAEGKKSHGCLTALIVLIIFGVIVCFGYVYIQNQLNPNDSLNPTNQGSSNKLFSRSATTNDILIDYDLDIASFGMKVTVNPQSDINNLELTIKFLDSNEKVLSTKVKALGNVKKGVQVNFSISIGEMGWSVAWNTKYTLVTVTGGTVSYFS